MKQTKVVTGTRSGDFDIEVNKLTEQGWGIIPESLRCNVATTSNAWESNAQTKRVFGVILEKNE